MKYNQMRQVVFPILAAFIWGTAFVAQDLCADSIGAFAFNATRYFIAVLALLVVILISDKLKKNKPTLTAQEKKVANKQLIPAATAYMGEVAGSAAAKTAAVEGISTKAETKVLTALSKYTDEMSDAADALKTVTDKVTAMTDESAKAHAFHDEVIPAMDALRAAADKAEEITDEEYWPLPCYSRMLFYTE